MDDVRSALRDQVDELDALVSGLDDAGWTTPSACPGWSITDVLVHLAQTNEAATASVSGRWSDVVDAWSSAARGGSVDELAATAVELSDRRAGPDVHRWWRQTAHDMVAAFDAVDPARRVPWVVGEMAARTLCTTRLSETWIHTTDVAHGLGVVVASTSRLWHVARLVHRTLPYAFERASRPAPDRVRFELVSPSGDTWVFGDDDAPTIIRGPADELCLVAGQREDAARTSLVGSGPDARSVLELMRTFA